jgi:hypothetical protein
MLEEYSEHFLLTLWRINTKVVIVDPSVANITIGESDGKWICKGNFEATRGYQCDLFTEVRIFTLRGRVNESE